MSEKQLEVDTARAKGKLHVSRGGNIYNLHLYFISQGFLLEILTTQNFLWACIATEDPSKLSRWRGKDSDVGKDWGQEEKRTIKDVCWCEDILPAGKCRQRPPSSELPPHLKGRPSSLPSPSTQHRVSGQEATLTYCTSPLHCLHPFSVDGNSGNSVTLYFGRLQNHCRCWLNPWN